MSRGERFRVFVWLLLGSALVLFLLAGASPLYPTNPWVDANCFHTVARGIVRGKLLYRDLIEQKGPLLYFLHVPAVLISPRGFFGVYLTEVLAMALFLYASWRTVSRFIGERCWPLLPAVAVLLASSIAFVWGDSAEELAAPLLAWTLCDGMRYFSDPERRMTPGCLLRNGLFAGCLFWIKFSLLGLHFAWMAVVAIESVIRERKLWPALRMCLIFLAGMALPALPWLIYFGANGALGDLWRVYFVQNTLGYAQGGNRLLNICIGLFGGSAVNPLVGAPALGGVLYFLLERREGRQIWRKIFLAAALICAFAATYSGGRLNGYYYYIAASFAPLGLVPFVRGVEALRVRGKLWAKRAGIACVALMCAAGLAFNPNLPNIGHPREETPQHRFAQIIGGRENPTLLNFGFLDGGFYLASGVEPKNPWFCQLLANREECFAEQSGIVERGEADFVITRQKELGEYDLDASRYRLVAQQAEKFNYKDRSKVYYLYERI